MDLLAKILLLVPGLAFAGSTASLPPKLESRRTFNPVALSTETFHLNYEESFQRNGASIYVRLWQPHLAFKEDWKIQVLQVLDSSGNVKTAKVVDLDGLYTDVWSAEHANRLFIYLKLFEMKSNQEPTHVFEILEGPSIGAGGIFFSKEDIRNREIEKSLPPAGHCLDGGSP